MPLVGIQLVENVKLIIENCGRAFPVGKPMKHLDRIYKIYKLKHQHRATEMIELHREN